MTDTEYIAAAQKPQAQGCEWKADEPDGCVLDHNRPEDCRLAMTLAAEGGRREDCREWRPVVSCLPNVTR